MARALARHGRATHGLVANLAAHLAALAFLPAAKAHAHATMIHCFTTAVLLQTLVKVSTALAVVCCSPLAWCVTAFLAMLAGGASRRILRNFHLSSGYKRRHSSCRIPLPSLDGTETLVATSTILTSI